VTDYIKPSTEEVASDIPATVLGFTKDIRQLTLYVESVRASEAWGDVSIVFEVETL
jgi:hypothetical protein